jgi:hypothetical protein
MSRFLQDDRDRLIEIHTIVRDMLPEVKENTRMRQRLGGIITGVAITCGAMGSLIQWAVTQLRGN